MRKFNLAKQHLIDADEKYHEHFSFAFIKGVNLVGIGIALIIHSILPCFFTTTASSNVKKMNKIFQNRIEQAKNRKEKNY